MMQKRVLFMSTVSRFCSLSSQKYDSTYNIYTNPCVNLNQYLEVDLFKTKENIFSPTIEIMKAAQDLFVPKLGHKIYLNSKTIKPESFPRHLLPEVAFIGRSNVGKSSLLKAIFRDVPELNVKTSKKPGHTKSAQFFNVGSKLCLVDMPGYGYAQPQWFTDCVEWYLKNRKNLIRTFLLIDGNVGFQRWDEIALDMLEEFQIPYAVVMTKIDKAPDSTRLKNLLHLMKITDDNSSLCCFPQSFMVSSSTYEGLAHFLAFVGHITGNLNVDL